MDPIVITIYTLWGLCEREGEKGQQTYGELNRLWIIINTLRNYEYACIIYMVKINLNEPLNQNRPLLALPLHDEFVNDEVTHHDFYLF